MQTRIRCGQRPLWSEIADVDAQGGFAASAVGLAGFTVCGTFVLSGPAVGTPWLARSRELPTPAASRVALTQVPQVLIARYLGHSSEDAFRWFSSLWTLLRPAALDRAACAPRVWAC
jgi:urease accessory protein